ncbi:MAG: hypothetical protein AAF547_08740 [Actinomycetota bacterium]
MPVANVADRALQNKYWNTRETNRWIVRQARADDRLERARMVAYEAQNLEVQPYKKQYELARTAQVNAMNRKLNARWDQLRDLLTEALRTPAGIDVVNLRAGVEVQLAPAAHLTVPAPEPTWADYEPNRPWAILAALPPVDWFTERRREAAYRRMEIDRRAWIDAEDERKRQLAAVESEIAAQEAAEDRRIDRDNAEMDDFRHRLGTGDALTVQEFFTAVLDNLAWPDQFPLRHRVAYDRHHSHLDVEFYLPTIEAMPRIRSYDHDEKRDRIEERLAPPAEVAELYLSVVAQTSLRVLRELFGADDFGLLKTIGFEGRAEDIERPSGQPVEPYLVSLTADVGDFRAMRLELVDPVACLRILAA